MASFTQFLSSLDADAGKRGKQFEHFVKWFLKNDPQWSTQVDEVWLWDEWPNRWGPDCGIDLIFKHKDGQTWAVQSKCYDAKYNVTKRDVDKFLSESNRSLIDKRLLIVTTDGLDKKAKQVCDAQDKEVVRYSLSHFEDADIEYPSSLADLNNAKPKPKPTPKAHQKEAIEAVKKGFADTDRGQLIMACGTGKTFTTLWIKEELGAQSTLILLPSLGLLSQTLHEWTAAKNQDFDVLCVCSDDSVGKKGSDEAVHDIADLAFPVTSDPTEIAAFLKQDGPKVVFSTYQSSNLIADAQADPAVPSFNLAIADEAHRCAGNTDGNFATILNGQRIRADKRLFTTATPRTYSTALKKGAEGRGIKIVGMDNEEVFGKHLFTLNFGEAIKRGLLTDYRVVIVGVDSPTIASYIENRELVKTESGIENDAETLAAQVALLKTMKDFDLHRMISFHSRVSRAEGFAKDLNEVAQWLDAKHRPSGELKTDFVSGDMPTFARRQKLGMLKNAKDHERALLTNARCLSEGVDVPSLDGVAFIDPRASQVDIIQAVGRAIRLSANKQAGTIVLPVFIGHGDNPEQALDEGNFKPIWDVLNALKSHDDVLADELDQMRVGMGKRGLSRVQGGFSKIEIDLPATVDKSFSDAIQTRLVESTTNSWDFWFGLLQRHTEENGGIPSIKFVSPDGFNLGSWISNQRFKKAYGDPERKARLESVPGWSWDPLEEQWNEAFERLKVLVSKNGTSNLPTKFACEDGFKLGAWIGTQRRVKSTLTENKKSKLESFPDWTWDAKALVWEQNYAELVQYVSEFGDPYVPQKYKTKDGSSLSSWIDHQVANYDNLDADKRNRLESLHGWVWSNKTDARWNIGYEYLRQYVTKNGNALVPLRYKTDDGYALGSWVRLQRADSDLSEDKKERLRSIPGWTWNAIDTKWEMGFESLLNYIKQNQNCLVPRGYVDPNGFKLGSWVGYQRKSKNKLDPDKLSRLESIESWVWNVDGKAWDKFFTILLEYGELNGSYLVPFNFVAKDGAKLGAWVVEQRKKRKSLSREKVVKLESLYGWAWDPLEVQWNESFNYLLKYIEEHNGKNPPASYVTEDGFKLGRWVSTQRWKRDKQPQNRIDKLESIPSWVWDAKS